MIYGNVDRLIHRVVKPDHDSDLASVKAGAGETLTTVIKSTYNTFTSQKSLAVSLGLLG